MSSLGIIINTDVPSSDLVQSRGTREQCSVLSDYFLRLASGISSGSVELFDSTSDAVAASGTITCANVSADDTVTIGSVTLTAKASPSGENQFSQAGTDTADAASLVSKINAHSVLSKIVSASSDAGEVTITALQKGLVGNHIALASSNGTRLDVEAFSGGTGGLEGTSVSFSL